nr:MAG TPA: hypothetical protein [Caudoviricetes sp.]
MLPTWAKCITCKKYIIRKKKFSNCKNSKNSLENGINYKIILQNRL